jgi:hypothetical protein
MAVAGPVAGWPVTNEENGGISVKAMVAKGRLYAWSLGQALRFGQPDIALGFLGGIGDDLLATVAIDEWLRRGAGRVWFFTRHAGLYGYDRRRVRLIPEEARYQWLASRLGRPMRAVSYSTYDPVTDRDSAVREHIIVEICRRAGLSGRIRLRPHLPLAAGELQRADSWADCIALQSASLTAAVPMPNKQWRTDRLQAVADHLAARGLRVVQVGSASDPALRGVTDLRGRTSLRETAAVLARARLFVGLVGFLMHLARAVECPGVIIYGGREPPELTGYSCNTNLAGRPACAPCWQRSRCDFGHVCMESIEAGAVIDAVEAALARPRGPLSVDEVEL